MQVAGEAQVGIHDLFTLQIVSNVADVERPVGIELQIARNTHVVVAYNKGVARGSITGCNQAAFEGYPVAQAKFIKPIDEGCFGDGRFFIGGCRGGWGRGCPIGCLGFAIEQTP